METNLNEITKGIMANDVMSSIINNAKNFTLGDAEIEIVAAVINEYMYNNGIFLNTEEIDTISYMIRFNEY